ncbi:MAG TPA: hypothetical protein PK560_07915 [bacterium]|nr:hypothetical protein [bacterium]
MDKYIINSLELLSSYFITSRFCKLYIDDSNKKDESILIDEYSFSKKQLWFWIKNMLFPDLLPIVYNVCKEIKLEDNSLNICDPLLENVLEKGIAENHLHFNAGKPFEIAWDVATNTHENYNEKAVLKAAVKTEKGYVKLKPYFYCCALARFIIRKNLENENASLELDCLSENYFIKKLMNAFCNGEEINKFLENENIHDLRLKINEVIPYKKLEYSVRKQEEEQFIFNSFKILRKNKKTDDCFRRLFSQYIKIKNIYFQYITEHINENKGLDVFQNVFKRQNLGAEIKFRGDVLYPSIFATQFKDKNIKKMEIRISPNEDTEKIRSEIKVILNAYLNYVKKHEFAPLIGIVFHFIKEKDKKVDKKCSFLYACDKECNYINHGNIKDKYKKQAEAIVSVRNSVAGLDQYIVGIDTASLENNCEPNVFFETYKFFREEEKKSDFSKPIGFTYHVGEDFRDILSGLRHIDEVTENLHFRAGDRIGHGIVLGIDIDKWAELNSVVSVESAEFLDNLLWLWGQLIGNPSEPIINISFVETKIFNVIKDVFGFDEGVSIRDLYEVYTSKFLEFIRIKEHEKSCCIINHTKRKYDIRSHGSSILKNIKWDRESLLYSFNCRYFIKDFEKPVVSYITDEMKKVYKSIQNIMCKKLAQNGIVVEANPTSNLCIGEAQTFEDYYIKNLSSPEKENVIITINSDDPVVFNTTLQNEYAVVFDMMLKTGKYSKKQIVDWIDKLRQNGMEYSFIKSRQISKEELIKEVENIIERL